MRPGPLPSPSEGSKAVGPILEFFRGRFSGGGRGRSRAGDDEDDNNCYVRYSKERQRCVDRYDDYHHQDFLAACLERAKIRRDLCNRNGGVPRVDEPNEWGPRDEETWRNFSR